MISIRCKKCDEHVQVAQRMGRDRFYCDVCDKAVKNAQAAERMRRWRAAHPKQKKAKPMTAVAPARVGFYPFEFSQLTGLNGVRGALWSG